MLSICIPTYQRPKFLRWTLNRLIRDFPCAQIVVSDNDNPNNELTEVWCLCNDGPVAWPVDAIDYYPQPSNIGAFSNMFAALSAAKGDYAVYCADDDYLLPEQIAIGIEYLDSHPEVAAYCAPCEIWNEVEQRPYWNAFRVEPCTFDRTQGVELFNLLILNHIWPEHLIYRLPLPLKPRTRAYWAFADIPDILAAGAIHFDPRPFYRNLLVHPVGERVQLGNVQCLTDFDEYRGGLEVLAHGLFGPNLAYPARHRIQEMISSFICSRLDVARRLYERAGQMAESSMLAARLSIASPVRDTV